MTLSLTDLTLQAFDDRMVFDTVCVLFRNLELDKNSQRADERNKYRQKDMAFHDKGICMKQRWQTTF